MARRKPSKRHWLRTILVLAAVPLIVWVIAFVIWFRWDDLNRWLGNEPARQQVPKASRPAQKQEPRQGASEKSRERITDDDRRKLDELLKQRN